MLGTSFSAGNLASIGFWNGALMGGVSSSISYPLSSVGNSLVGNKFDFNWGAYSLNILTGSLAGEVSGGIKAKMLKRDFYTAKGPDEIIDSYSLNLEVNSQVGQDDGQCGLKSAKSILKSFGIDKSIDELKELNGGFDGVSDAGFIDIIDKASNGKLEGNIIVSKTHGCPKYSDMLQALKE
jgi:hypothetical protein